MKEHIKTERPLEHHLPLFQTREAVSKITYNRKNCSDIFEAIIGSVFLANSTFHAVHDFLEQKMDFYGKRYKGFLAHVVLPNQDKLKCYSDIFCSDHGRFLDWAVYEHPDRLRGLEEPVAGVVRILNRARNLERLKSKPRASLPGSSPVSLKLEDKHKMSEKIISKKGRLFERHFRIRFLQPEEPQQAKHRNKRRRERLKRCRSASITPRHMQPRDGSIGDLDSLIDLSFSQDRALNSGSFDSVTNPFKSDIKPGGGFKPDRETRSEKPANLTFEIKIMDLKIAHSEFCKKYFRGAFQGRSLADEGSRFEILETILDYK